MRFFAHDGKTTHGPAEVEELLKLPGFDGDTLVCPVGSADSADWKAALAYPPFKQALLTAQAPPAPVPAPIPLPLPPAPKIKTTPCPICAHLNPEEARYCNACGARVDGTIEPPAPLRSPEPVNDPFASNSASPFPLDAAAALPMPMSAPEPARKPSQPGKMGQLAAFEETVSQPLPPLAPSASEVLISASPETSPIKDSKNKKSAAIAAVLLAAFVASALAWKKFAPVPRRKIIAALAPPAPAVLPAPVPVPDPAPVPTAVVLPPRPARRRPPAAATTPEKTKRKRARKLRPRMSEPSSKKPAAAAKKKDAAADNADSELEALLNNAAPAATAADAEKKPPEKAAPASEEKTPQPAQPAKKEPAAAPKRFSLPGLDRPVSGGARKPQHLDSEPNPAASAEASAAPAAEPAPAQAPSAAAPAEADGGAEGDQLALSQVKEQFDFCTQLLAQNAYGDHYDTCLCKEARKAAKRGAYVAALKASASNGKLENAAKITSSKLVGGTATLVAHWRVLPNEFGRDVTQNWRLEDGLWCRAP